MTATRQCAIPGCTDLVAARTVCRNHYIIFSKKGIRHLLPPPVYRKRITQEEQETAASSRFGDDTSIAADSPGLTDSNPNSTPNSTLKEESQS